MGGKLSSLLYVKDILVLFQSTLTGHFFQLSTHFLPPSHLLQKKKESKAVSISLTFSPAEIAFSTLFTYVQCFV